MWKLLAQILFTSKIQRQNQLFFHKLIETFADTFRKKLAPHLGIPSSQNVAIRIVQHNQKPRRKPETTAISATTRSRKRERKHLVVINMSMQNKQNGRDHLQIRLLDKYLISCNEDLVNIIPGNGVKQNSRISRLESEIKALQKEVEPLLIEQYMMLQWSNQNTTLAQKNRLGVIEQNISELQAQIAEKTSVLQKLHQE